MNYNERFLPYQDRMQQQGLPQLFIDVFAYYYHQLLSGDTGIIPEQTLCPVHSLPRLEDLPDSFISQAEAHLPRTAIFKLNGGLGTSMGLQQAKSLLVVKNGHTFLDIIAKQAVVAGVPLVLMNSFATQEDSCQALSRHPNLKSDVPQTFVQHMEPKIRQSDLAPADWPLQPELAWCPPGHGDLYTAMVTQGVLEKLLLEGYRYAFVSNADNLGATLDLRLLGYFIGEELPFLMEVSRRTESDGKGGHLAKRCRDGRLILRESAQCSPEDEDSFQDIQKHRYFNTNNLWLNLEALDNALRENNYNLRLPLIRNSKTLDPRDRTSEPVYQLETAMGSAIEVFEGADAVEVPRTRFAPVKKTNDLLAVRSDVYVLGDDFSLTMHQARNGIPPVIDLDPRFYQFISDFDQRFASGVPSLLACSRLHIRGDVAFCAGVRVEGDVEIIHKKTEPLQIPPDTVLRG